MSISKIKKSSKQSEIDFNKQLENYSSKGEIYRAAINHYQYQFPHLNAKSVIASALGIGYTQLSNILNDESGFSSPTKQDEFFLRTMFPRGYDLLKEFTFPTPKEVKK